MWRYEQSKNGFVYISECLVIVLYIPKLNRIKWKSDQWMRRQIGAVNDWIKQTIAVAAATAAPFVTQASISMETINSTHSYKCSKSKSMAITKLSFQVFYLLLKEERTFNASSMLTLLNQYTEIDTE